jgi:hypothetical protein
MPNYYEILAISPSASAADIEAALDGQYNQVRRLVNHYDQNVVNQANQALLILEQARTALLDPQKRSAYDQSLGLNVNRVGGVADPTQSGAAPVQAPPMTPPGGMLPSMGMAAAPLGFRPAPVQPPAPLVSAWQCNSCGRTNPVGTMFCQQCGQPLGRICPNCQASYEAKANFCPSCGLTFDAATRRTELGQALNQRNSARLALATQASSFASPRVNNLETLWTFSGAWAVYTAGSSIVFLVATLFRLIFMLVQEATPAVLAVVSAINFVVGLLYWGVWVGVLVLFFFYLEQRKGIKSNRVALAVYAVLSLIAMQLPGRSFAYQVLGGSGSPQLFFPVLLVGAAILWGAYTLRQFGLQNAQHALPDLGLAPLSKVQPYLSGLMRYDQKSPLIVAGAGLVLCVFTLLFSGGSSIFSLFGGLCAAGSALVLGASAYHARNLVDGEQRAFLDQKEMANRKLAQMDAEIQSMQQELSELTSRAARH